MRQHLEIRETSPGNKSLFTNKSFEPGDKVFELDGEITPEPTQHSIQVAEGHLTDPQASFMNHSCDPSCEIIGRDVFAKKKLPGELTFDYETTEDRLRFPFFCTRGEPNCRGKIIGREAKNDIK